MPRLAALCDRYRGEEMSRTGLLWRCPSCLEWTVPGAKKKGGGYQEKVCPHCGYKIEPEGATTTTLVVDTPVGATKPFIDGVDINRRYVLITPNKYLRTDVSSWDYKDAAIYDSEKILIRQAGVPLYATLDRTGARCPQSVYIYRLTKQAVADGYTHPFVLGALLSRTMIYYIYKRFAEIDPAKGHPKVTHERLEALPIPALDVSKADHRRARDKVSSAVEALLDGHSQLGGAGDLSIEQTLRTLWGLSPDDGAYINGQFHDLPDSALLQDLFPTGRPAPPLRQAPGVSPAAGGSEVVDDQSGS